MKRDEALDFLRHHAKQHPLVNHPKSQSGFLGMLVSYGGLKEEKHSGAGAQREAPNARR